MATVPKTVIGNPEGSEAFPDSEATVHVDGNTPMVDPNPIKAHIGQTIVWHLQPPQGMHFVFDFSEFADRGKGPFSTFTVSATLATGEGYGHGGSVQVGQQVSYDIGLAQDDNTPIWNHDPVIDTQGDPPGPEEEA